MRLIVQRFLLAVALAVSAVFIIPAPAQAGGDTITICPYMGLPDDCVTWEIPILEPDWEWPPGGCPECLLSIDILDDLVNPAIFTEFNAYFGKGFALLAESRFVQDPDAAKEMRWASVEYFLYAAKVIEKNEIALDSVGWFDPKAGKFFEDEKTQPYLDVFGKELAAGAQAFQALAGDPEPQPNIEAALSHLDAALAVFSKTG
ncbi:hypothetical protein O1R50_01720 [Glycomyces luteolus]|uniref:Uncharacterized protein n=1 Tax=Glycomyces luteolus TaxID=2670330 RepID=A0A9X3SNL0_9ACTN|nr:hypothetical protein [Glycomyces luteolus]MDA1358317.1 hypothetical protein [Glycomyces luteolus]